MGGAPELDTASDDFRMFCFKVREEEGREGRSETHSSACSLNRHPRRALFPSPARVTVTLVAWRRASCVH